MYLLCEDDDAVVVADGLWVVAGVLDDPGHGVPGRLVIAGRQVVLAQQNVQVLGQLNFNGAVGSSQNVGGINDGSTT